jgi:hypothetical protein
VRLGNRLDSVSVKAMVHHLAVVRCDVEVAVAVAAVVHLTDVVVVVVAVVAVVVDFVVAVNNKKKTFNICVHIVLFLHVRVYVCVYISI